MNISEERKTIVRQTLANNAFITVNKTLSRAIGLLESAILCELIAKYNYFYERHELQSDDSFFCTIESIEQDLGVSRKQQTRVFEDLEEAGLIKIVNKGLPQRRFFYIQFDAIEDIFYGRQRSLPKAEKQFCPKGQANNNLVELNNTNTSTSIETKEVEAIDIESRGHNSTRAEDRRTSTLPEQDFSKIKPRNYTIEERQYEERANPYKTVITEVINYLNKTANKHFRTDSKMISYKDLIERLEDGFTLEDCKHVIDVKTSQWLKDARMNQFLRPMSLFSIKFEGYLNEQIQDTRIPTWQQMGFKRVEDFIAMYPSMQNKGIYEPLEVETREQRDARLAEFNRRASQTGKKY